MMLGTFGLRPKATLRSRAIAIAHSLAPDWEFELVTTPWDHPSDAGCRWNELGVPVANTRVTQPWMFPLAAGEMVRRTTRMSPSLVHLFKPKGFGDIAARWLAKRLPVVVDMDDWEGNGGWNEIGGYGYLQRRIFDWQERTWPRMAAAVTVASRQLEHRAQMLGARPESVFYVPNGLTNERFNALKDARDDANRVRERLGLSGKRTVLLYTRFIEFEPVFAVHVVSLVRSEISDAVLVIVGASANGTAERSIGTELRRSGLQDSVRFTGWTEPNEIPSIVAACDVAIHPFDDNLVNRSKCSVKLLELMAAGLPIVSNPVGENAEMIQHGQSGVLVPSGDAPAMARHAIELLRDRERAMGIGFTAQDRVRRHYLWGHLSRRIAEAYEKALDNGQNPRQ